MALELQLAAVADAEEPDAPGVDAVELADVPEDGRDVVVVEHSGTVAAVGVLVLGASLGDDYGQPGAEQPVEERRAVAHLVGQVGQPLSARAGMQADHRPERAVAVRVGDERRYVETVVAEDEVELPAGLGVL